MREIKYSQAIAEAHIQSMERDPNVFLMGVGIGDPTGIFGTTLEPRKRFGDKRVFDTPMSENTVTGIGVGAAICGMRPVLIHARNDFLLLTMDQIVNHAAKWRYMAGGKLTVPFLIRAIIGRGWGQAAQHSQSLQAMFMHVPGLQLAMPSAPADVKGLILQSMVSEQPTIIIEHRWLHEKTGPVPEEYYTIPYGKGQLVRKGKDVTLVAISHMVLESKTAVETCAKDGVDVELIDPRSLRPLDEEMILSSVRKTGRLVIADTGWKMCGASAEIAALAVEKCFEYLKAPVVRIALPDTPTPCSYALEERYYPNAAQIAAAVTNLVRGGKEQKVEEPVLIKPKKEFTGPF